MLHTTEYAMAILVSDWLYFSKHGIKNLHVYVVTSCSVHSKWFLTALKVILSWMWVKYSVFKCYSSSMYLQFRLLSLLECFVLPSDVPPVPSAPVILFRPRAWNMFECNMMVSEFGMIISLKLKVMSNGAAHEYGVAWSLYVSWPCSMVCATKSRHRWLQSFKV